MNDAQNTAVFRDGFIWGAASSAYQIEGAANEDGKGLNVWDVFSHEPGRIADGSNGDVACDHYHRYLEDVRIMKEIGLQAYRFSVSWTRLFPEGTGKPNEAGFAFYDRLIDALLENGIIPYLTLHHWDMPLALQRQGGWQNERSPEWFGAFAAAVSERFSDRVKHFITFNEPQCIIWLGYVNGSKAPGLKLGRRESFFAAHNLLKAHGRAVQELRRCAKQKIEIGYAPTCTMTVPATDRPEDIEAARTLFFDIPDADNWAWNVSWWSDPVVLGHYPEDALERFAPYLPKITDDDMKLISEPIDFYGENIYTAKCVKMGENGKPEIVKRHSGYPTQAMGWAIVPEALYWGPKFLYERYRLPFYVTENGTGENDRISLDGRVHDPGRIDFIHRYLLELKKAVRDGVDLRGYLYWSLTDNFEWEHGYTKRFGLTYVDYPTQKRMLKDSAYWYRDVIRTNGSGL